MTCHVMSFRSCAKLTLLPSRPAHCPPVPSPLQFGIVLWELFCASDPFAGVPRAHLGHAITKECKRWVHGARATRVLAGVRVSA